MKQTRSNLHKELQKVKRNGHYYVTDILDFIEADRRRVVEEYELKMKEIVDPLVKLGQIKRQPLPPYEHLCQAIEETLKNAGLE